MSKNKIYWIASFIVLIVLAFGGGFIWPARAEAETIIKNGTISSNTVWTQAQSPYIIDGDLYIDPGVTLTIEPGVVVKLKYIYSSFFVSGKLNALGTASSSIYFTSFKDDLQGGDSNRNGTTTVPAVSDWGSIYLLPGSTSNFSQVILRYAGNTAYAGGINNMGGLLSVSNSKFSSSAIGIDQQSGTATVTDSEIFGNDFGFYLLNGTGNITQSKIYNNSGYGIYSPFGRPVMAKNNWWGDASGPYNPTRNPTGKGNAVSKSVDFIPWLGQDPDAPVAGNDSVAFIPGIEASFLYRLRSGCSFLNCEDQLWTPNINSDVRQLYLTAEGASIDPGVYTREVIDEAMGFNVYKSFLAEMNQLVTAGTIAGFKALPYDWRFGLDETVNRGSTSPAGNISYANSLPAGQLPYLIAELTALASSSKSGKVTIVAHSNGGLVTKKLIQKLAVMKASGQSDLLDKIDRVILVAVPELGTPQAIPALLHGYEQSIPFMLDKSVARTAMENMPGAYNLLPSDKYFSTVSEPVVQFATTAEAVIPGLANYGEKINTASGLRQFLLGQLDDRAKPDEDNITTPNILNAEFVAAAKTTHDSLDDWQYPPSIEVIQIAGWGVPTLKGVEYYRHHDCAVLNTTTCVPEDILGLRPITTIDGDRTVVSPSATGMASSSKTWYVDMLSYNKTHINKEHKNILEITPISDFIRNKIIGSSTSSQYFSSNKPVPSTGEKNLIVSTHSPVVLDIYDNQSNHTGLIPNPDPNSDLQLYEENIPNSAYLDFGGENYVVLPDATYTVKLAGTGFGTFTYEQELVDAMSGRGTTTLSFTDILVTPRSVARLIITPDASSTLELDINGDGKIVAIEPNRPFDPILYLQLMRQVVASFGLEPKVEKNLENKIDNVIKSILQGKVENSSQKIKQMIFRTEIKHRKDKQISQSDKDELIYMLDQLLDNLK